MGNFKTKKRLSKKDLTFCKTNTRFDEPSIKALYKTFRRDCPSGKFTQADMVDMYKMFFPDGNAYKFANHVLRILDQDQNGVIEFKEFIVALDIMGAGTVNEKFRYAFRMYDINGDGAIDQGEMNQVLKTLYDLMGKYRFESNGALEERTKAFFAEVDKDGDGYLTVDEFLRGCLKDIELSNLLRFVDFNKPLFR